MVRRRLRGLVPVLELALEWAPAVVWELVAAWVREVVARWRKEANNHPATDRIAARATRNL